MLYSVSCIEPLCRCNRTKLFTLRTPEPGLRHTPPYMTAHNDWPSELVAGLATRREIFSGLFNHSCRMLHIIRSGKRNYASVLSGSVRSTHFAHHAFHHFRVHFRADICGFSDHHAQRFHQFLLRIRFKEITLCTGAKRASH
jgi:hypothetical protein